MRFLSHSSPRPAWQVSPEVDEVFRSASYFTNPQPWRRRGMSRSEASHFCNNVLITLPSYDQ